MVQKVCTPDSVPTSKRTHECTSIWHARCGPDFPPSRQQTLTNAFQHVQQPVGGAAVEAELRVAPDEVAAEEVAALLTEEHAVVDDSEAAAPAVLLYPRADLEGADGIAVRPARRDPEHRHADLFEGGSHLLGQEGVTAPVGGEDDARPGGEADTLELLEGGAVDDAVVVAAEDAVDVEEKDRETHAA
eukprot:CAMPEP_0182837954 /NCGR_PEP_ID=MMETSP0006_2-20121128/23029_1 /TAXON_ID=97485 /ORGANISM="Prymnesium parvum, Strain Texoma1" /LENGTH=187 /DNA_ID=CAMNT_0024966913 /DNA_START=280 /DNA_END=841 /DNA_ORIENTATION=-